MENDCTTFLDFVLRLSMTFENNPPDKIVFSEDHCAPRKVDVGSNTVTSTTTNHSADLVVLGQTNRGDDASLRGADAEEPDSTSNGIVPGARVKGEASTPDGSQGVKGALN